MAENQPTLFDIEIWKPVLGYAGIYEVSNMGRVRGLDRVVETTTGKRRYRGKIMKTRNGRTGYSRVNLKVSGRNEFKLVHHLVLEAFVGPMPVGMETCHNNGVRDDNRLENLRWGTKSSNTLDQVEHGTHVEVRKTHCPRGHDLIMPNLKPSEFKRGKRVCLACQRANSFTWAHPELKSDFQKISDQYYESIMSPSNLPQSA